MADYAGAVAAIKAAFVTGWAATTPYCFVNDPAPAQKDSENNPIPWVLFEIVSAGSVTRGRGVPGNNVIIYDGLIKGHVFVPNNSGLDAGLALALQLGEIFRNKLLYDAVTAGCFVRTGYDTNGQPRISGGDIVSNDGEWFTWTATIAFEYWHRA